MRHFLAPSRGPSRHCSSEDAVSPTDNQEMPSVETIDFVKLMDKFLAWPLGLGQWFITVLLFFFAPYTTSIYPSLAKCDYGDVWMTAKDRWLLHNPFGSFHAAALTNLAEGAGTLSAFTACTRAGQMDGGVYMAIPSRIDMNFFIKSKGTLVAKCKIDPQAVQQAAKDGSVLYAVSEIWEEKGRNGQPPRKTCEGKFEFNVKRRDKKPKAT